MAVNVTPEVAAAHNELRKQCEKFEAAVDEFCASSPQALTYDFYASGCIPIAEACADALSEFSNARSYEETACEQEIQAAKSQAATRIRKAEEKKEEVEKVGNAETKTDWEEHMGYCALIAFLLSIFLSIIFFINADGFWNALFAVIMGIICGVLGSPIVYIIINLFIANQDRSKKDQAIRLALHELKQVESEQKRKGDEVTSSARSKKDQAVAYIDREYQDFNMRLCQCLDKLQAFVDAWTTENANVTSVLDEIDVQNLGKNNERIAPHLTRVGTVGFHIAGRV